MTEHLFVRLHEREDNCSWVAVGNDGRLIEQLGFGSLVEAAEHAVGRRVVLLVPGPEIVTTQAELPTTSQARLRQMLPYSLEDTFAEDIDQLMFAVGPRLASGAISVSVTARENLDRWLEAAAEAGIVPSAVYAETDGVPDTPSTLNIIVEGDVFFGRRPDQAPLVLQGLGLGAAFAIFAATSEHEAPIQHAVIYIDEAAREEYKEDLLNIEKSLSSLRVRLIEGSALPGFAAKLVHYPGTNFLQGAYAPKSNWAAMLRPWRMAAGLLVAFGVSVVLAMAANYVGLRRQDGTLTEAITSACTAQFSSSRLSQCEALVQERLRAAGDPGASGGESFLSTLGALAEHSGTAQRFETLSYRNGVLDLQLIAPDIPALDELTQQLNGTGRFQVSIQRTNPEEDGIEGRLQIVGVAP